jgi:hypothetical protein
MTAGFVWFGFMVLLPLSEKTTDLSQVIQKLYHIMLYTLP